MNHPDLVEVQRVPFHEAESHRKVSGLSTPSSELKHTNTASATKLYDRDFKVG